METDEVIKLVDNIYKVSIVFLLFFRIFSLKPLKYVLHYKHIPVYFGELFMIIKRKAFALYIFTVLEDTFFCLNYSLQLFAHFSMSTQ